MDDNTKAIVASNLTIALAIGAQTAKVPFLEFEGSIELLLAGQKDIENEMVPMLMTYYRRFLRELGEQ